MRLVRNPSYKHSPELIREFNQYKDSISYKDHTQYTEELLILTLNTIIECKRIGLLSKHILWLTKQIYDNRLTEDIVKDDFLPLIKFHFNNQDLLKPISEYKDISELNTDIESLSEESEATKNEMNLQKSIRRILRKETNYTNTNVNIGDVYEESEIYQYIQKLHYKRDYDFWEGDLGERIEKFPYYIVKKIPTKDIEMDEYQLDKDDMEEYIEMFKERGSYPPIVLGKKSYGYYNIIDGTHRANALRELGFDKIICFVGKKKI